MLAENVENMSNILMQKNVCIGYRRGKMEEEGQTRGEVYIEK